MAGLSLRVCLALKDVLPHGSRLETLCRYIHQHDTLRYPLTNPVNLSVLPIETPRIIAPATRQPLLLLLRLIRLVRLILLLLLRRHTGTTRHARRRRGRLLRRLLLPAAALLAAVDRAGAFKGRGALAGGQGIAVAVGSLARRSVGVVAGGWGLLGLMLGRVGVVAALLLLLGWWLLHLLGGWVGVSVVDWALVTAGAELLRVAGVQRVDAVWSDLALKGRRRLLLVAVDGRMGSLRAGFPADLLLLWRRLRLLGLLLTRRRSL